MDEISVRLFVVSAAWGAVLGDLMLEMFHDPERFTSSISPLINGSEYTIPSIVMAPDYRIPEPAFIPLTRFLDRKTEFNRPYRLTGWGSVMYLRDDEHSLLCYCTTVFRRVVPLAGCAVITTRHILTTASSTERVLAHYSHKKTLTDILGAWYDNGRQYGYDTYFNASYYMTPARIHYHPKYSGVDKVNVSHSVPVNDLAVWAATYRLLATDGYHIAALCQRSNSRSYYDHDSPTPIPGGWYWVVGYQYIRAYRRRPNPWIRYGLRTTDSVVPCPKLEWGWMVCFAGRWAPLGLDVGAALHYNNHHNKQEARTNGLLALNAFSMKLRSRLLTHYFTILDTHPVLDFLYASYMGRLPFVYLDHRFYNTQWKAPIPKPWFHIEWSYPNPEVDFKVQPDPYRWGTHYPPNFL